MSCCVMYKIEYCYYACSEIDCIPRYKKQTNFTSENVVIICHSRYLDAHNMQFRIILISVFRPFDR